MNIELLGGSGFSVHEKDGVHYTWIPSPTNSSKLLLHRWIPEEDRWENATYCTFLPSKAWGSLK